MHLLSYNSYFPVEAFSIELQVLPTVPNVFLCLCPFHFSGHCNANWLHQQGQVGGSSIPSLLRSRILLDICGLYNLKRNLSSLHNMEQFEIYHFIRHSYKTSNFFITKNFLIQACCYVSERCLYSGYFSLRHEQV